MEGVVFEMWEAGVGLQVVLWLQSFENGLFNALAELLAVLGDDLGYLVILPLLYWSVDKRLGRWLLVVLVVGLFVVIGAKELFERPRPYIYDAEQVRLLISEAGGYGFPSGHVGLSTALWGFVALWARRAWGYWLLAAYIVLMAWARMYGGVHFPQDVAGGFMLGTLVAGGIYLGREWLAGAWARLPTAAAAGLVVLGGVLMAVLLLDDEVGVTAGGILIGGGLGAMLEHRRVNFSAHGPPWRRAVRFVGGLVLTLALFFTLDTAFDGLSPEAVYRVVRYAVVSFVIIGLYPLVAVRSGLAGREAA